MTEEPKDVRLPFMVTASEAKAIDEWRYANHIPSRAEAMRRLLMIGLGADREVAALQFSEILGGNDIKGDFLKAMIAIYSEAHPAEDWFDKIPD